MRAPALASVALLLGLLACTLPFSRAQLQPGAPWPASGRDAQKTGYIPATVGSISQETLQWKRMFGKLNNIASNDYILTRDGLLVGHGEGGSLMGVSALDGTMVFKLSDAGWAVRHGPVVGADDTIYVIGENTMDSAGKLSWIKSDGTVIRELRLHITQEGSEYYLSPRSMALIQPNNRTSMLLCEYSCWLVDLETGVADMSSFDMIADSNNVFDVRVDNSGTHVVIIGELGLSNSYVQVRSAVDLNQALWSDEWLYPIHGAVMDFEGRLILGTHNFGVVYPLSAMNLTDGSLLWESDLRVDFTIPPVVSSAGFMYGISRNVRELVRVDTASGDVADATDVTQYDAGTIYKLAVTLDAVVVATRSCVLSFHPATLQILDKNCNFDDFVSMSVGADGTIYRLSSAEYNSEFAALGGRNTLCPTPGEALSATLVTPIVDYCEPCPSGHVTGELQMCVDCTYDESTGRCGECDIAYDDEAGTCDLCEAGTYLQTSCPTDEVSAFSPPSKQYASDPEPFDLVGKTLRYTYDAATDIYYTDIGTPKHRFELTCDPNHCDDLGKHSEFSLLSWYNWEPTKDEKSWDFRATVLGQHVEQLYIGRYGYIATESHWGAWDLISPWAPTWEHHRAAPRISALFQDFESGGYVYVASDAEERLLAVAYRGMLHSSGAKADFTVAIWDNGPVQVTYHRVESGAKNNAIVGLSMGAVPAGWQETVAWGCSTHFECAVCPAGTAAPEPGSFECAVQCPGNGCNGRGTCDPVTATCTCDEGYTGDDCIQVETCPAGLGLSCDVDTQHYPPAKEYFPEDKPDLTGRTLRFSFEGNQVGTEFAEPVSALEQTCTTNPCDDSWDLYYNGWLELQYEFQSDDFRYVYIVPITFNYFGEKMTQLVFDGYGTIGLGKIWNSVSSYWDYPDRSSNAGNAWGAFWEFPQLAVWNYHRNFYYGQIYVTSDVENDAVVIAYRNVRNSDNDGGASFTVFVSQKDNFIQVTYHHIPSTHYIVGVSQGQGQAPDGWQQLPSSNDWACRQTCAACPEGTASPNNNAEVCFACPGDGCSGHGECNAATAVCTCTGLYVGDACDEKQNVAASMVFGFITLLVLLAFGVPCICFGKEQSLTKRVAERAMHPFLWKVVVNMAVARHFKNLIAQKKALAFLYTEQTLARTHVIAGRCFIRLFAALRQLAKIFVVFGSILFVTYMALFLQMIGNVFLMAKGLFGTSANALEDHMNEIYDSLDLFFSEFDMEWISQALEGLLRALGKIDFRIIAIDAMEVTCEGSQAPGLLLVNLLVTIGIVLLISLSVFPMLKITLNALVGTFSDMLAIRRNMGQRASRMPIVILSALLAAFEGVFKYAVQMGASLMEYEAFFPRHPSSKHCDDSAMGMDTTLALLSSAIAFLFFLPLLHIILRTFVPGIPRNVTFPSWAEYKQELRDRGKQRSLYGSAKRGFARLAKSTSSFFSSRSSSSMDDKPELTDTPSTKLIERFKPADSDLDAAWVLKHETFKEQKAERLGAFNFEPVPNVPNADILVKLIYHEFFYKCGCTRTLRLYLYCMVWKVWKLVQITFGYWNDEAIRAFQIRKLAEKFDDDPTDDENHHTSMISLVGVTHTLMWQLFSGTVVLSKLAEAVNEKDHPPFIVAKRSGITVQSMWSEDNVKLEHKSADAVDELPGGSIAAVIAVRLATSRKKNEVVVIIRGYETNFAEDVELKGVLQLGLSPTHGVSKEEGLLSVQVDEIVNEVCLRGRMSEEDFKRLPRFVVHQLLDYEVDKASLKGFVTDERKCAVCFSIWNCCKKCLCCCCCCCCGGKSAEEKAIEANHMRRGDEDLQNSFAAKIEQLGQEGRVLPYNIKNKEKNCLVRRIGRVRGVFSGRFYKFLVRIVRFGTELGFVLSPDVIWLQIFAVISLPSVIVSGVDTFVSCGIEFDDLSELLSRPFSFFCSDLSGMFSATDGGGSLAAGTERLSGMIEMLSGPVSELQDMMESAPGTDTLALPDGAADVLEDAIDDSGFLDDAQQDAQALAASAKSQLSQALETANEAEVVLEEQQEEQEQEQEQEEEKEEADDQQDEGNISGDNEKNSKEEADDQQDEGNISGDNEENSRRSTGASESAGPSEHAETKQASDETASIGTDDASSSPSNVLHDVKDAAADVQRQVADLREAAGELSNNEQVASKDALDQGRSAQIDAQAQPGEDVEDAPASDGEEDSAADPEESDEDTH